MKKSLCEKIFEKELKEEQQILENDYLNKKKRLQYEMKKIEKKYGIIKQIFYLFPNSEIIGIDCNKNNDELLIVINSNDTIYLFGEHYQCLTNLPRIFFKVCEAKEGSYSKKYIKIYDILMEDNNIGNGTIAMKALIKYATKNNIKWIEGYLSSVDNDHADRRNHYYKKFGFEIKGSSIRLEITPQK